MSRKKISRQEWALLREERWTAGVAERVLAAQEASGESVAEFARRQGFCAQRLFWWRSRLGDWRSSGKEAPSLVPVVVAAERGERGGEKAQVELRLGEVTVEVLDAASVSPGWLAALVRELGAAK